MSEIDAIRSAILEGANGEELAGLPLPEEVRGALVKQDEQEMFAGLPSEEKDPRKSTHVEQAAQTLKRPVAAISESLLQLELDGWVKALPGARYVRVK